MIIEQVTIEGFLSYRKRQTVVFPDFPICLVNGSINSDPSLSNGAGKSTLFEAIAVSFFGRVGGRADVLDDYINDLMNSLYIETVFLIDDRRYRSVFTKSRGSASKHEFFYENQELGKSEWKITDRKASDILGLSFYTYNSTIYLNEREALKFIDGEGNERKEILRELLNLNVFEESSQKAGKKVSELSDKISINLSLIDNKETQIKEETECRDKLFRSKELRVSVKKSVENITKELKKLQDEKKVVEVEIGKQRLIDKEISIEEERKSEHEKSKQNLLSKSEKLESKITETKRSQKEADEFHSSIKRRKMAIRNILVDLKKKNVDGSAIEKVIEGIHADIEKQNKIIADKEKEQAKIQTEIRHVTVLLDKIDKSGNVCPVTEQSCPILNDEHKKQFRKEKQEELDNFTKNKEALEKDISVCEEELERLANIQEEKLGDFELFKERKEKISENEFALKEFESKEKNYVFEKEEYEKRLNEFQDELINIKAEFETFDKKISEAEDRINALIKNIDETLENRLNDVEIRVTDSENKLDAQKKSLESISKEIAVVESKIEQIEITKKHIKELLAANEELSAKKKVFSQLVTVFGKEGIQKSIIKESIPFLEQSSLEMLKVFNGDSEKIKIHFDLDPKKTDGDLKKKGGLDILVLEEGKPAKDLRMYSGGERVRLIFGIILGLAKLLSRRSGKKHETLIIDEKIAKLDRKGIDQFVEVIDIISKLYRRIYIITHIEALKDVFDEGEIMVNKTEKDGSIATVV